MNHSGTSHVSAPSSSASLQSPSHSPPLHPLPSPQWSSFALDLRTHTSSEGNKLIRHWALSVPLIPCLSLTICRLRRVLLLQWNHTRTHIHTLPLCAVVWAVAEPVYVGVLLCVLQCECVSPGLWVFRERLLSFFLSFPSTNRRSLLARVVRPQPPKKKKKKKTVSHVLASSTPLIWWQPHHNLVKRGRRDSTVTLVSMSQLFTLQTSEEFPPGSAS